MITTSVVSSSYTPYTPMCSVYVTILLIKQPYQLILDFLVMGLRFEDLTVFLAYGTLPLFISRGQDIEIQSSNQPQ